MKKLMLGLLLFIAACGPLPPPPPYVYLVATATVTDYYFNGYTYVYGNDCGPIYYYSDRTYDVVCTYPIDGVLRSEIVYIGNTLSCPGPSYRSVEYVNGGWDLMDYLVDCE